MSNGFNGWANWETWNVALWIGNDESLYDAAKTCSNYQELVALLWDCGSKETPDGCRWDDPAINGLEICAMMADLTDDDGQVINHQTIPCDA